MEWGTQVEVTRWGWGGMEGCNWCPLFPEATQFTTNEGSSCHSQENTNCFIFFLNSNVQKNCARYCPVSQLIVRVQLLSGFGFKTQYVWTLEDTFDIWETYLDILGKIYTLKKHIWKHLWTFDRLFFNWDFFWTVERHFWTLVKYFNWWNPRLQSS